MGELREGRGRNGLRGVKKREERVETGQKQGEEEGRDQVEWRRVRHEGSCYH